VILASGVACIEPRVNSHCTPAKGKAGGGRGEGRRAEKEAGEATEKRRGRRGNRTRATNHGSIKPLGLAIGSQNPRKTSNKSANRVDT